MSAELSPPGPPDDRITEVERRLTVLERHRDGEAARGSRSDLAQEVTQQEVRDLSVKLARVIARQDQAGARLEDVVAAQLEQARILERIGGMLGRHGEQLRNLADGLERQGRRLDGIDGRLDDHGETLSDLRDQVAEVLRRLPPPAG